MVEKNQSILSINFRPIIPTTKSQTPAGFESTEKEQSVIDCKRLPAERGNGNNGGELFYLIIVNKQQDVRSFISWQININLCLFVNNTSNHNLFFL